LGQPTGSFIDAVVSAFIGGAIGSLAFICLSALPAQGRWSWALTGLVSPPLWERLIDGRRRRPIASRVLIYERDPEVRIPLGDTAGEDPVFLRVQFGYQPNLSPGSDSNRERTDGR
jgi:hypothetical protein